MDQRAPSVSMVLALLAVSLPLSVRAQSQPGPTAASATATPPTATDFQLEPKKGQDAEQQWFDRYDCDSRARQQSGYDPLRTRGIPLAASDEYLRAMTACLREHGYEVRYAPPEAAAPPIAAPLRPPGSQRAARELRYHALSVEAGAGYTAAAGSTAGYVHGGPNAGAALNWFPGAALPIGVRLEGSYTWSKPGSQLLALNGVGYNEGRQGVYGGDLDLRLNLRRLPSQQQLYLAAGIGRYRIDATLQKISTVRVCGTRYCSVFQTLLAEESDTSPWEPSWNVGVGWEIALDRHTAFFAEARYRYIHGYAGGTQIVPIWLGLRF